MTRLFAALLALVVGASASIAQPGSTVQTTRRGLELIVSGAGACEADYVAPPATPARCLYFVREPITLEFTFANGSPDRLEVWQVGATTADAAFRLEPIHVPAGAPLPMITVGVEGMLTADGTRTATAWSSNVTIAPQSALRFPVTLTPPPGSPAGVYELRIVPQLPEQASPIFPTGTLVRYELRVPVSTADRAEILRRQMMASHRADRTDDMLRESDLLLKLYPSSSAAYYIKAELAIRAARPQDAAAALARARDLVATGQDQLFVANARPEDVKQSLERFSRTIEALEGRPARGVH